MTEPCYEYIQLEVELGDLDALNALGSVGWKIAAYLSGRASEYVDIALLERQVPDGQVERVRKYYEKSKAERIGETKP